MTSVSKTFWSVSHAWGSARAQDFYIVQMCCPWTQILKKQCTWVSFSLENKAKILFLKCVLIQVKTRGLLSGNSSASCHLCHTCPWSQGQLAVWLQPCFEIPSALKQVCTIPLHSRSDPWPRSAHQSSSKRALLTLGHSHTHKHSNNFIGLVMIFQYLKLAGAKLYESTQFSVHMCPCREMLSAMFGGWEAGSWGGDP